MTNVHGRIWYFCITKVYTDAAEPSLLVVTSIKALLPPGGQVDAQRLYVINFL